MEHFQEPWYRESFQIILYDPAVYPTPTGDGKIKFQYSEHTPDLDLFPGYTVGIQNEAQTCGLQSYYHFDYGRGTGKGAVPLAPIGRQQGEPIAEGMAIEFTAIPDGEDDQLPTAVSNLTAVYEEPFVRLNWDNPEYDVNGFELPFLDGTIVRMDGEPIADPSGAPGAAMEYSYRERDAGAHTYDVRAYLGSLVSDALSTELTVPTRVAYADHDAGNVRYTITDQGISGFTDSSQSAGSGFRYGVDDPNWLYVGGLWAGTDAGYVLNRDFAADPYVDWIFWNDVEGPTSAVSDQDYLARYDDSGHSFPKNLRVTQDSWSWSIAPYDDFAIVRYSMENWGDDTLEGLYVGQFMDWDIPDGNAGANQGATHAGLRMAYMWQDGSYPYVGVALLDTLPGTAPPVANLAFVHNATYVYANAYIDDVDRFHFLSGDDPAYVVPATTGPADWSAIVSAGPFDVDPGGSVEVAFAIVGGDDQADILANAGRAHEIYTGQATAVSGQPETEYGLTLVQNWPNPFNPMTSIRYTLPERLRVKLTVYNTSGRLVRTLVEEEMPAGAHVITWDSRNDAGDVVSSGVYFCRLEVGDWSSARKMVLLK